MTGERSSKPSRPGLEYAVPKKGRERALDETSQHSDSTSSSEPFREEEVEKGKYRLVRQTAIVWWENSAHPRWFTRSDKTFGGSKDIESSLPWRFGFEERP